MSVEQPLSGKRVAITGAGRGLGRALAIVAADSGADVILLGRNAGNLQLVAETIADRTTSKTSVVPCDLSQPDSIAAACKTVVSEGEALDILVNNGAPWLSGKLSETSEADIVSTVSAAVTGTILLTKGLLPGLGRSNAADVVTIVSTSGYLGWDSNGASVAFSAAKHGQSGFSDALRHELKKENVRVAAIYPPDFDDLDPLDPKWERQDDGSTVARMTNRDIVATVMFVVTAPRSCSFPVVVVNGMQ